MALTDNARSRLNIACADISVGDELQTKIFDKTAANTITGTQTFTTVTATTTTSTTLNCTNLDAGASGTAGTVDIFPTTAAKGKLQITCADQTGDTTVTLTTAAMGGARTITIPDPGAAASIVMTEGAQTIAGVKTFSAIPIQSAQAVYCTANKTFTSDTTLALVTGLSVTLAAAGIYYFRSHLQVTASVNGGVKFALGGTATATGLIATFANWSITTQNVHETITALDTAAGDSTAVCTDATIEGTIEVNAGGTFTIDAAQNASHADTTTIHKYSSLFVTRIA